MGTCAPTTLLQRWRHLRSEPLIKQVIYRKPRRPVAGINAGSDTEAMKEVLFRLGQVAWWIGALGAGIAGCFMLFSAVAPNVNDRLGLVGASLLFGACWGAFFFAVSFVLTGSFWRRPRS